MHIKRSSLSAVAISMVIHVLALGSLAFVVQQVKQMDLQLPIETVFDEERVQEQFEQQIETATEAATSMTYVAGGAVTGNIGGGGGGGVGVTQASIEQSDSLKGPDVQFSVAPTGIGALGDLGKDLGEGEVTGETGAAVEGYGTALSRITQEIVRHMRETKVLVVWLFDESESMKDDQADIRDQFHKVYEELGIVEKEDKVIKSAAGRDKEILQTVIYGYGLKVNELMKQPSSDLKEIRAAIDRISIDGSGTENTCAAVNFVADKYGPMAKRQKRKLMIVLVTDESGNDGGNIDSTIDKVKRYESPVYVLGREAVFGYPYARIRWKDPKFGLDHWLQIDRGPETAIPEALQFDGLHARADAFSSGFGPYEQVRMAKESGGIFFVLPTEEQNLIGQDAIDKRKFQFYDMKEYLPWLVSRREYEEDRKKSKFRETLWEVIVALNPYIDKELNIQEHHYGFKPEDFAAQAKVSFTRGIRALSLLNEAAKRLEKIKPLRKAEESTRWRANYDLILAQVYAYRVRLFQALLALDQHMKNPIAPKNKMANEWHLQRTPKMLAPDAQVVKATKIDMEELKKQEQIARDLLAEVVKNHPHTPWSNRAEFELAYGFGFTIIDGFRDPRYRDLKDIKFPKP